MADGGIYFHPGEIIGMTVGNDGGGSRTLRFPSNKVGI